MAKVKLSAYINKIEAKYILAREKWEAIQKELVEETDKYNNMDWSRYTWQGRNEVSQAYFEKAAELKKKLEDVREEFKTSVEDIRKDSNKLFDRTYCYKAGDIDPNGMAIIQNGALNNKELMGIANDYRASGNYTMYYMVAAAIKENQAPRDIWKQEDFDAQAYKMEAARRRASREDHELIDTMKELCLYGLRDEENRANGTHNYLHAQTYAEITEMAGDIEAAAPDPWE